jgi:hypothetical protein
MGFQYLGAHPTHRKTKAALGSVAPGLHLGGCTLGLGRVDEDVHGGLLVKQRVAVFWRNIKIVA